MLRFLSRRIGVHTRRRLRPSTASSHTFQFLTTRASFSSTAEELIEDEVVDVVGDDDYSPPLGVPGVAGMGRGLTSPKGEGLVVELAELPEQKLVWGKYAGLAGASVLASHGKTQVLVTVVTEKPKPGQPAKNFLPLTVEFKEKMSAAGWIPTTFLRRELMTKDHEILAARAVDRSIRPLFQKGHINDTQIICTVMSYDRNHDALVVALNAVSACLNARGAEFGWDIHGPVAAMRVGLDKASGDFVLNPPPTQEDSDLDLLVVMREDGQVMMLEGGASSVSEETFVGALQFAQKHRHGAIALQTELRKQVEQADATAAKQSALPAKWSFSSNPSSSSSTSPSATSPTSKINTVSYQLQFINHILVPFHLFYYPHKIHRLERQLYLTLELE